MMRATADGNRRGRARGLAAAAAAVLLALAAGCNGPRPVETSRSLGQWNFEYGRYAEAATYYGEIIEEYPGDGDAQYHYGVCMSELGDVDSARRSLETAAMLEPNNEEISFALADVLYRQEDTSRLYQLLRDVAESTGSPDAWAKMSEYALLLGDPDTARTAAMNAVEVDRGRSTEAYFQAAMVAEYIGDPDDAVRRLRQAYGVDPHDPRVLAKLREYGEVPGPTIALPPGR